MRITVALLALALLGCPKPLPPAPPGPPGPSPTADAGLEEVPCMAICRRLKALDCEAAKPTAEGAPCTEVCETIQSSGTIGLDVECVKRARSCADVDKCGGPR